MSKLSSTDTAAMFAALALLLGLARTLGEVARRAKQPAVLGEILAGVLLGPTVLGTLAPAASARLFPSTGPGQIVLQGFGAIAVSLFLLAAGMEVHVATVWKQLRVALYVSMAGILVPFSLGYAGAHFFGEQLLGRPSEDPAVFALFFATAMSISAMAVIAKTLMDLNLFRTDLGMTIMAAAIVEDFAGWLIFAVVLGLVGGTSHTSNLPQTLMLTLGFAGIMLSGGRLLLNRILPWIHAHTSWPSGVMGMVVSLALAGAAFTEWAGIHAVFGAFIVGVALGDSDHLRERTRQTIDQFVSSIFAPIFFASIGLKVNFIAHFRLPTVLLVLLLATVGKVVGCSVGARISGMRMRESLAVGFGLNARGSMEIILGSLGLGYGIITEELFVGLVVMTVTTAALSGPAMQRLLQTPKGRTFESYLAERCFVARLSAHDAEAAIHVLAERVAPQTHLSHAYIAAAVLAREHLMPTGIARGLAVPHARVRGLKRPLVAVALCPDGVNFGAPDRVPAKLIFLLLTAEEDAGAQLELIADIAQTFVKGHLIGAALEVEDYTDFLALVRTREGKAHRRPRPSVATAKRLSC